MDSRYRRKQLEMRRALLDQRGQLNAAGKVLAVELKRLTRGTMTKFDAQGRIDPIATAAAASRREIWDHFEKLLCLEPYVVANLREEED